MLISAVAELLRRRLVSRGVHLPDEDIFDIAAEVDGALDDEPTVEIPRSQLSDLLAASAAS